MALVQKENKQLTVDGKDVNTYLADGYDVLDEKTGKVLTPGAKKQVDYKVYAKLQAELDKFKSKQSNKNEGV